MLDLNFKGRESRKRGGDRSYFGSVSIVVVGYVVVIGADPAIVLKFWPFLVRAKSTNSFCLEVMRER
jgi:hypothetical protein